MRKQNVVLIGFMGSGKSMTSKKLGICLNKKVVSTDELIEKKEGRTIAEIFRDSGEPYFRRVERKIVREVSERSGVIIDCGGGVVLDAKSMVDLKKNGTVFYLSASPECLYKNIKNKKSRPLLNGENPLAQMRKMLQGRLPYYNQADVVIDADFKTVNQITKDVLRVLADG